MRPLRSRPRWGIRRHCLLLLALPSALAAQTGGATEGALELLFPIGARAVAMGQATVADATGTESVWWNPALIARAKRREVGVHFNKTVVLSDNTLSYLQPLGAIGAVALSARLFDEGQQDLIQPNSTTPTGTITIRDFIYAATFAAPFGDHVDAGITYKFYQLTNSCVGECITSIPGTTSTSAVDVGLTLRVSDSLPLSFGVAVRNLGLPLQVNDEPQRDPLPARLDIGVSFLPKLAQLPPEAQLRADAGVVARLDNGTGLGLRGGAELSWQNRLQARAGYVVNGPTGSGPSIGLGVGTGQLQLDIARFFNGFSSGSGDTPIYLSLRYQF